MFCTVINDLFYFLKYLLIMFSSVLPFESAISHCTETAMSALTVTHKSFSFTVVSDIVLGLFLKLHLFFGIYFLVVLDHLKILLNPAVI